MSDDQRIPRVIEVERVRHRAVDVCSALHRCLEAAGDDARLRRPAHLPDVVDRHSTDAEWFCCAGQGDGEPIERDLFGHVDRCGRQRVVTDVENMFDEPLGQGFLHVLSVWSTSVCTVDVLTRLALGDCSLRRMPDQPVIAASVFASRCLIAS